MHIIFELFRSKLRRSKKQLERSKPLGIYPVLELRMRSSSIKRYILAAFILSVIGHSIYFGIFKTNPSIFRKHSIPGMQVISLEQFDYLKSASRRVKDVIAPLFPKTLSIKQPMWADMIDIVGENIITKNYMARHEEDELVQDTKEFNLENIQLPAAFFEYRTEDYYPLITDIFEPGLQETAINKGVENTVLLNNGDIKMSYYIEGPIAARPVNLNNIERKKFNIEKQTVNAKFRLWVTKDGRVNQVIIEDGSSFALIDSEIVRMIKTWHFSPLYGLTAPNYEWGVVMIRLMR